MNFINYITILVFLIGLIFILIGCYIMNKAHKIRIEKISLKEKLENEIKALCQDKIELDKALEEQNKRLEKAVEEERDKVVEHLKIFKENMDYASAQYFEEIEDAYSRAEDEYKNKVENLRCRESQVEEDIKDAEARFEELRSQINAATEAQLREREKEQKLDYYKLFVSTLDMADIQKLDAVKLTLHNPVVLSKLIWTTYFQKQATEMCNRILGTNKICGIYKITDLITKQCYVGQSVDVAQRWKDHLKCGLGIDAPANKLYTAMQHDGVWNFTFELLEECPREKLNEREAAWIYLYQSDKLGLNSTKGNK